MKNEDILRKAIDKAINNGWEDGKEMILDDIELHSEYYTSYEVYSTWIFSHDFAKAFWGKEKVYKYDSLGWIKFVEIWQQHLQQMVLEEEPLKYLERFL